MKQKKRIGWLLIAVAVVFLILEVVSELPYLKHAEQMKQIQAEYTQTLSEGSADSYLDRKIDFMGLKQINPDIVAWIWIPGTPIDYPVLKNPYDDHYLHRDPAGQYSYAGSIFMRASVPGDFSGKHTILYGHNMIDGQMFGWLKNYGDVNNLESHPYIYIYLPERREALKWQVYSAYRCPDATTTYRTVFQDEKDYQEWQDLTLELGNSAEKLQPEDRILTLSTCTESGAERFVVHGVLKTPEDR